MQSLSKCIIQKPEEVSATLNLSYEIIKVHLSFEKKKWIQLSLAYSSS